MTFPNFPYVSFPDPLPVPTDDRGDFCFVFDGKWKPYILGALFPLLIQRTWDTNDEDVIDQAGELLYAIMTAKKCEVPDTTGVEVEDCEVRLRYCGGKLQVCDCGTWVDVPSCDGNPIQPQPGQPGAGAPQPSVGGAPVQYCGAMAGNSKWLLPTTVSTDDTITFEGLEGAWNDGFEFAWHCPDGWLYALGSCAQPFTYNGATDPLQGVTHMTLIAKIGSTYYDVLAVDFNGNPTTFTVPSGHENDKVVLQANVDYGGQVWGEVSFCVNVTRGGTLGGSVVDDFTTGEHDWAPRGAHNTSYVSATGFAGGCDSVSLDSYHQAVIQKNVTQIAHITHIKVTFNRVYGNFDDGTAGSYAVKNFTEGGGGLPFGTDGSMATGTAVVIDFASTPLDVVPGDYITVAVVAGYLKARGNCASFGSGAETITKIETFYSDFNPFA